MTVREWHNFNHNRGFSWSIGDYAVKIYSKKSYHQKDIILTAGVADKDLCRLFGSYELIYINRSGYQDDNGAKICLGIWPNDMTEETDNG